MADVKVVVDLSGAEKKLSPQSVQRGKIAMASQAITIMDPYVPMRAGGGAMRAAVSVTSDGDVTYTKAPYVRAQFYGTNGIVTFKKYTTPGTGSRWDKPLKANIDKLKKAAIKGMGIR